MNGNQKPLLQNSLLVDLYKLISINEKRKQSQSSVWRAVIGCTFRSCMKISSKLTHMQQPNLKGRIYLNHYYLSKISYPII